MSRPPPERPDLARLLKTTAPSLHKTVPDTEVTRPPVERHAACLVVIRGSQVGRKIDLDGELIVGRDATAGLCLPDGLVSRSHAKFAPDGAGIRVVDLCSTNGTFVNDQAIESRYLDDGDQVAIGNTVFKFISRDNIEAAYHEHVYSLTRVDGLTGIHNRPSFDEALAEACGEARHSRRPLALMLFDIDHFKRCNDRYGHLAGDHVLREVAGRATQQLRSGDFLARYGGEEFALIIRELAPQAAARYADHLRGLIANEPCAYEGVTIPVTISAGLGLWNMSCESPGALVELADRRLYRAKAGGRNRVIATED